MTIQQTACDKDQKVDQDVGYVARRLPDIVLTGVYECNNNCKCAKTCLNRVVQHPMRLKLQVRYYVSKNFVLNFPTFCRFLKQRREAGASGLCMIFLKDLLSVFMLAMSTLLRKPISRDKTLVMSTLLSLI